MFVGCTLLGQLTLGVKQTLLEQMTLKFRSYGKVGGGWERSGKGGDFQCQQQQVQRAGNEGM